MSTVFCPQCGAEYLEGYTECADCLIPLVSAGERDDDVDDVDDVEDGTDDDVVYELDDWEPGLIEQLNDALAHEAISHSWEEDRNLVVAEADSDRVEELLDELEYPDALEESADEGGDDEASYEIVSELFVAADRLMHAPDDAAVVGEAVKAVEAAVAIPRPFGFSPEEWGRIKAFASGMGEDVSNDADDEVVVEGARNLRDLLRKYV